MPTVPPLSITDGERAELQRRVRAHTTPQRAAKRARVVLLAAEGVPNRQIATLVGMNQHTVSHWRHRFEAERLAGLEDRPRPGRPLVYGHDQRLRIVATVTQQPPDPASHWSHSQLAKVAGRHRHLGLPDRPDPGRPGHQAPPGAGLDHPP
jgi:transposase